jgi:regulator of RNase E activity RraB
MDEKYIQENIAGHNARNKELLKQISERGVDLDTPRPIDILFWVADEQNANSLVETLAKNGLGDFYSVPPDDETETWIVEGQVLISPRSVCQEQFTEKLVRLAAAYSGDYDGWGTSIGEVT